MYGEEQEKIVKLPCYSLHVHSWCSCCVLTAVLAYAWPARRRCMKFKKEISCGRRIFPGSYLYLALPVRAHRVLTVVDLLQVLCNTQKQLDFHHHVYITHEHSNK